MKKLVLAVMGMSMFTLILVGTSYSWQGRMASMGDPYGLVGDESDFLIHPALISSGKGFNVYSHYRFTHTEVTDWEYDIADFSYDTETSGSNHDHEALLGTAFSLGPGRLGTFLTYNGSRAEFDGDLDWGAPSENEYELESDLDAFSLRFIYGLPIGCRNIGFEASFSYHQEENKSFISEGSLDIQNYPWGGRDLDLNTLNFMIPYDSDYWQADLKSSISGCMGPVETLFTINGGFILTGDNEWHYKYNNEGYKVDGDVEGWNIGGDLWLRYPVRDGLSLPFLISAAYQEKSRDGSGSWYPVGGYLYDYTHKEKSLTIEAGGGVDIKQNADTELALGAYYNYFRNTDDLCIKGSDAGMGSWWIYDYRDYPEFSEHRITVKFAAEHQLSDSVSISTGINCFYGWLNEEFTFKGDYDTGPFADDEVSMDGDRYGIMVSLGASIPIQQFTFEPFINGGYQERNLDGDGDLTGTDFEMDTERQEWFVGGGLSVLFGN